MEIDCRKGYARWSPTYDTEKNPLIAVEQPVSERLLDGLVAGHALDAGAGTGRHSLRLARLGSHVTAIDSCPEMLAVTQARAHEEGLPVDCRVAALDDPLPFDAGAFALVVCALALTHVREMEPVVREFHRVSAAGGHLLITDFHPDHVAAGWRTEFRDETGVDFQLPNMNHTVTTYLAAVQRAGFRVLEVVHVPVRDLPPGYVSEELMQRLGQLNLCLLILAQKPPANDASS